LFLAGGPALLVGVASLASGIYSFAKARGDPVFHETIEGGNRAATERQQHRCALRQ